MSHAPDLGTTDDPTDSAIVLASEYARLLKVDQNAKQLLNQLQYFREYAPYIYNMSREQYLSTTEGKRLEALVLASLELHPEQPKTHLG